MGLALAIILYFGQHNPIESVCVDKDEDAFCFLIVVDPRFGLCLQVGMECSLCYG
jgi:hypothetical protein